jgi:exopolysaccharide biosynthesis protein
MKLIILLFASLFLSCSASKRAVVPLTKLTKGVEVATMDYTVTNSKGSTLPTKIYLLDVRLSNSITLVATTADDTDSSISVSEEQMTAKAPLSAHLEAMQANRPNIKVLAGVNADFFHIRTNQMPCGVIYRNGRCIKGSYDDQTTVFALLADGTARCMSAAEYELLDKSLIREAVSGRQMLLDNGVQQSCSTRLEPRTAVGVTRDGKRLFILVADGRRKEYSNGLSYADMAQIFKRLGAYDAINLDGGGSSSFSIEVATGDFEPINRPSDRSGERPVPNGLAVVELR